MALHAYAVIHTYAAYLVGQSDGHIGHTQSVGVFCVPLFVSLAFFFKTDISLQQWVCSHCQYDGQDQFSG